MKAFLFPLGLLVVIATSEQITCNFCQWDQCMQGRKETQCQIEKEFGCFTNYAGGIVMLKECGDTSQKMECTNLPGPGNLRNCYCNDDNFCNNNTAPGYDTTTPGDLSYL